jgi:excisionase family DNA binding protein
MATNPQSIPPLLLTPKQAAEALAISQRKLWSMTASGEVPHVRLGRCVRYPLIHLQVWLARRTSEVGGIGNDSH